MMAVKTEVPREDFAAILSGYRLGEYLDSRPLAEGAVQTNYWLGTTAGQFVFRLYENRSLGSVGFETHLIRYLTERQYPCPAICNNRQGEAIGVYRQKPYVIFEFIHGHTVQNPTRKQKRQLIEKAALLQELTRDYTPVGLEHRWNYSPELCRELAGQAAMRIANDNALAKLRWFEAELQELQLPGALPKGICHCDFHFSNVLFAGGEFRALLDFDDANYTYLTFDLATLIDPFRPEFNWETWAEFEPGAQVFDFEEARWTAGVYHGYRRLSQVEQAHLFDVYKLSILFDAIWYFQRGEASDFYERRKIEALNALGREGFAAMLFPGG